MSFRNATLQQAQPNARARREHDLKRAFLLVGSLLLLGTTHAQDCPVEVKLMLSSPAAQPVIAALGFKKRTESLVYFFDTESLDLLMQGIIVRVRQGANNDLTVKLRAAQGKTADDHSQLRRDFPCEIDRTRERADTSYAVERQFTVVKVPESGADVYSLLSESQKSLLTDAGASIDWVRVIRIANIRSTKWQTSAHSRYGKLALELWEWSAGEVLEVSSKAPAASDVSHYTRLERLLQMNGVALNANQDTKTATVLKTLGHTATSR
jgi:hypothetical protein